MKDQIILTCMHEEEFFKGAIYNRTATNTSSYFCCIKMALYKNSFLPMSVHVVKVWVLTVDN